MIEVTSPSARKAGAVLGTLLSTTVLLIIVVVAIITAIIVYSKYKKSKLDDTHEDHTEDLTYNYMYHNPSRVSALYLGQDFNEGSTSESNGEATTGTEQNATCERSEISLFPNIAYTKKITNAATAVIYESIDKSTDYTISQSMQCSVQNPLHHLKTDSDNEYESV